MESCCCVYTSLFIFFFAVVTKFIKVKMASIAVIARIAEFA